MKNAIDDLRDVIEEALEYEKEEFEGGPDDPINISNADLTDWFCQWRETAKRVLERTTNIRSDT